MIKNPTKRFTSRANTYNKFRPGYPEKILTVLAHEQIVSKGSIIADIGSGTGIFTKLLLDKGYTVFAVEPNDEMRHIAEYNLSQYSNFKSINAQAEKTTLENSSIDVITAAQSFHWFDQEKAKIEFNRILKPKGFLVLIWNDRLTENSKFQKAYEDFLRNYCPEYKDAKHRDIEREHLESFYGNKNIKEFVCDNSQTLNFQGLKGRLLSSSYCPKKQQKEYLPLMDALKVLFEKNKKNGKIKFDYLTRMFYGSLNFFR